MHQSFIIILDGMMGAGKTTIANKISSLIPRTAVIGMDKVKRFISDFERGERDNTIAKKIIATMTETYIRENISVIIEQSFKNDEEVKIYKQIARTYNLPLYKIQIFCQPEIAFKRILERQKEREIKVPIERIKRNISLFKDKTEEGFFVINTSFLKIEDILEQIKKLIGK